MGLAKRDLRFTGLGGCCNTFDLGGENNGDTHDGEGPCDGED
jgi:hypothetical protein